MSPVRPARLTEEAGRVAADLTTLTPPTGRTIRHTTQKHPPPPNAPTYGTSPRRIPVPSPPLPPPPPAHDRGMQVADLPLSIDPFLGCATFLLAADSFTDPGTYAEAPNLPGHRTTTTRNNRELVNICTTWVPLTCAPPGPRCERHNSAPNGSLFSRADSPVELGEPGA